MQIETRRALQHFEAGMEKIPSRFDLLPDLIEECLEEIDPEDYEDVVSILEKHTHDLLEVAHLTLMFAQDDPRTELS